MKKLLIFLLLFTASCIKPSIDVPKYEEPASKKSYKIFFIGDSMSSDDPGNISMNGQSTQKSFGWYLKQNHLLDSNYQFRNYAVSGVGIAQMQNQAQAIIIEKDTSRINIVCILGAINNISFNGMTGAQCYQEISALHSTLKANGFKTIGISLTSRRQLAYFTEQQSQYFWTQIIQANSLFEANKNTFCSKYIDLQLDSLRQQDTTWVGFAGYSAATQSSYFEDGCHFSLKGRQAIATSLDSLIKTF